MYFSPMGAFGGVVPVPPDRIRTETPFRGGPKELRLALKDKYLALSGMDLPFPDARGCLHA
ncbi:hypothetical protein Sme01_24290 [Sphaerisporangium melleum]|uniref:Uncharacterized protein n=1 Tax=Sphaerisporangium melleum TaxID=321316 RepID=A0A917QRV1_9ACTN|nr:hypothetical protein GCM10007964_05640 [Sphaerisporangium melleum]GII69953.1 hypothetical protein Sme01_24290 [Sphaerisporangium melleum]